MPPGQDTDGGYGQIRLAATVCECIGAGIPVRLNTRYGAFLRFDGITGDYLNEPQEPDGERALDRDCNALALNGYFVSRHIQPVFLRSGDCWFLKREVI